MDDKIIDFPGQPAKQLTKNIGRIYGLESKNKIFNIFKDDFRIIGYKIQNEIELSFNKLKNKVYEDTFRRLVS